MRDVRISQVWPWHLSKTAPPKNNFIKPDANSLWCIWSWLTTTSLVMSLLWMVMYLSYTISHSPSLFFSLSLHMHRVLPVQSQPSRVLSLLCLLSSNYSSRGEIIRWVELFWLAPVPCLYCPSSGLFSVCGSVRNARHLRMIRETRECANCFALVLVPVVFRTITA